MGRYGTGRGTLEDLRDGSGNPWGGPGRVGRYLGEVRNGFGDPRKGTGRVGGPSGMTGTGRETIGEVRNGSEGNSVSFETG